MAEREIQRVREPEARQDSYDWLIAQRKRWKELADRGQIVIKEKDVPWEQARQGRLKYYLHLLKEDTAVQGWLLFVQDIRTHSGRHRHQGGLAIYVLEGKGWTTVDGVRFDWEEGDLILLPIKPQGCEHQHFNAVAGSPCKWLAMVYNRFTEFMCSELEQREVSPDWTHG